MHQIACASKAPCLVSPYSFRVEEATSHQYICRSSHVVASSIWKRCCSCGKAGVSPLTSIQMGLNSGSICFCRSISLKIKARNDRCRYYVGEGRRAEIHSSDQIQIFEGILGNGRRRKRNFHVRAAETSASSSIEKENEDQSSEVHNENEETSKAFLVTPIHVPHEKAIPSSKADLVGALRSSLPSDVEAQSFTKICMFLEAILHAEHKARLEELRMDYSLTHATPAEPSGVKPQPSALQSAITMVARGIVGAFSARSRTELADATRQGMNGALTQAAAMSDEGTTGNIATDKETEQVGSLASAVVNERPQQGDRVDSLGLGSPSNLHLAKLNLQSLNCNTSDLGEGLSKRADSEGSLSEVEMLDYEKLDSKNTDTSPSQVESGQKPVGSNEQASYIKDLVDIATYRDETSEGQLELRSLCDVVQQSGESLSRQADAVPEGPLAAPLQQLLYNGQQALDRAGSALLEIAEKNSQGTPEGEVRTPDVEELKSTVLTIVELQERNRQCVTWEAAEQAMEDLHTWDATSDQNSAPEGERVNVTGEAKECDNAGDDSDVQSTSNAQDLRDTYSAAAAMGGIVESKFQFSSKATLADVVEEVDNQLSPASTPGFPQVQGKLPLTPANTSSKISTNLMDVGEAELSAGKAKDSPSAALAIESEAVGSALGDPTPNSDGEMSELLNAAKLEGACKGDEGGAEQLTSADSIRSQAAARFERNFMRLLRGAQFEGLSAADLQLSTSLNSDYLLTLPIEIDWKRASSSNAILFRRGYTTEREEGRLFGAKFDYVQSIILQRFLSILTRPLLYGSRWLGKRWRRLGERVPSLERARSWLQEPLPLDQDAPPAESWSQGREDVGSPRIMEAARRALPRYEAVLSSAGSRGMLLRRLLVFMGLLPSRAQGPISLHTDQANSKGQLKPHLSPRSVARVAMRDIWLPASRQVAGRGLWSRFKAVVSIFFSRSVLQEPAFQELVLLYTKSEASEGHDPLGCLQLNAYKDIPIPELKVVFPDKKLTFRGVDTLRLDLATVAGLLAFVVNYRFEDFLSSPSAFALDVIATVSLVVFVTRALLGYKQTYDRYQLLVNKTLYEKTIASGFGVVHFLVDASEEQQFKEAALAYAALRLSESPLTLQELEDECERMLSSRLNQQVEMPVKGAVSTLLRLGLATLCPPEDLKEETSPAPTCEDDVSVGAAEGLLPDGDPQLHVCGTMQQADAMGTLPRVAMLGALGPASTAGGGAKSDVVGVPENRRSERESRDSRGWDLEEEEEEGVKLGEQRFLAVDPAVVCKSLEDHWMKLLHRPSPWAL